eukprot:2828313-Prymnesium_polylepis.1
MRPARDPSEGACDLHVTGGHRARGHDPARLHGRATHAQHVLRHVGPRARPGHAAQSDALPAALR